MRGQLTSLLTVASRQGILADGHLTLIQKVSWRCIASRALTWVSQLRIRELTLSTSAFIINIQIIFTSKYRLLRVNQTQSISGSRIWVDLRILSWFRGVAAPFFRSMIHRLSLTPNTSLESQHQFQRRDLSFQVRKPPPPLNWMT